jgi:hypothetical protein
MANLAVPPMPLSHLAFYIFFGNKKGVIVIFSEAVYFDESEMKSKIRENVTSYTVACLFGSIKQWKNYEDEWNRILEEAGIDSFHMNKFESRIFPYDSWNEEKRHRVLSSFIEIIQKTTIRISASISHSDYELMKQKYPKYKTGYGFCLYQCLLQVEKYMDLYNLNYPTAYIISGGAGYGKDIIRIFESMEKCECIRKRFRYDSYDIKYSYIPPFQGADILAYESNKEMVNYKISGIEDRKIRKSAFKLVFGESNYCVYFGDKIRWIEKYYYDEI